MYERGRLGGGGLYVAYYVFTAVSSICFLVLLDFSEEDFEVFFSNCSSYPYSLFLQVHSHSSISSVFSSQCFLSSMLLC